jgi:hypothetical protein
MTDTATKDRLKSKRRHNESSTRGQEIQTASGAHPGSYPVGTVGCLAGAWGWLLPCNVELKKGEAIPPLPHTSSVLND